VVVAQTDSCEWGARLYHDGWTVTHNCKKKKFKPLRSKPVWGDTFYTKYAKQLAHWKEEAKCIRCWATIPPMLILMLQLNDKSSINALNYNEDL